MDFCLRPLFLLSVILSLSSFDLTPDLNADLNADLNYDLTVDQILAGIRKGDAIIISRHFDDLVEITVSEKSNSYSRTQAEIILRDFFSTHTVRNFTMVHRSTSNASEYYVGMLTTSRGEFRTSVLVKYKGDKKLLQELRFE